MAAPPHHYRERVRAVSERGRILVTGATGFLGSRLARAFAKDGRAVRVLVRREVDADRWRDEGFEVVRGDLLDRASLDTAVEDIDTVLHSAALVSADVARDAEIHAVNATGTKNLVDAAAQRVRAFVFQSSIAVYGGDDFRDLDESAPCVGANPYGASKIAAESMCREAAASGAFRCVVLRPCQIYGPGDRAFAPKIRALVANPDHRIYGDPATLIALVHVDDVVQATRSAVRKLENRDSPAAEDPARAYNITSGESVTAAQFLTKAARAVGRNDLTVHPIGGEDCVRDATRASRHRAWRTLGFVRRPFVALQLRDFTRSRHVTIDRARRELDYRPAIRFDDSFEHAIRNVEA